MQTITVTMTTEQAKIAAHALNQHVNRLYDCLNAIGFEVGKPLVREQRTALTDPALSVITLIEDALMEVTNA